MVEYDSIVRDYTPRYGTVATKTKHSKGMYLETPTLHYSIGTKITPSVMKLLKDNDIADINVHKDKPSFEPEMQRAMGAMKHVDDWMVQLGGFHLKKNLLESVHTGKESTKDNISYIPSLAEAVDFGKTNIFKGSK